MNLGAPELLVVFLVLLLLFGAGQVPKLARSLGKAQREFRTGLREITEPDEGASGRRPGADDAGEGDRERDRSGES